MQIYFIVILFRIITGNKSLIRIFLHKAGLDRFFDLFD